jgi:inorganic pyrophosphatase/exopolyphosphatase
MEEIAMLMLVLIVIDLSMLKENVRTATSMTTTSRKEE